MTLARVLDATSDMLMTAGLGCVFLYAVTPGSISLLVYGLVLLGMAIVYELIIAVNWVLARAHAISVRAGVRSPSSEAGAFTAEYKVARSSSGA